MNVVCPICYQNIWLDDGDKILFCLRDCHITKDDMKEKNHNA